jgi:hypothetical protein
MAVAASRINKRGCFFMDNKIHCRVAGRGQAVPADLKNIVDYFHH